MENSVLGNALEGVPEEEEDEQNVKDSKVDSTENIDGEEIMWCVTFKASHFYLSTWGSILCCLTITFHKRSCLNHSSKLSSLPPTEKTRDELRVQVYDAMAEKKGEDAEKKGEDAELVEGKQGKDAEKSGDVEKMEAGDQQQNTEKEKKDEQKSDVNGSKSEGEDKTEKVKEDKTESGEKEEDAQGNLFVSLAVLFKGTVHPKMFSLLPEVLFSHLDGLSVSCLLSTIMDVDDSVCVAVPLTTDLD